MVIVSKLPHAEFRPNDHQEDASHFSFIPRINADFRVLRTLKFIERLQRYTVTLLKSIQSLGPIMHLTGAFVVMATSLGCSLFGNIIPKHFGNIILTFFTLIKIITLDEWFDILQDGSVEYG